MARTGVIIMNSGSPDAPTVPAIKTYLAEFLADKRLVNAPSFVWLPVLHGIILNTRPQKTVKQYEAIWTDQGSPLVVHTLKQVEGIKGALLRMYHNVEVDYAMRYGNPSLESVLERMDAQGISRVIVLPLYPQTSYVTVGSCKDRIMRAARQFPQIGLEIINGYSHDWGWMQALAHSIKHQWNYQPGSKLLFSYHSVPLSNISQGDTYQDQIESSTSIIAESLGIPFNDWEVGYQSRFDRRGWLRPFSKDILTRWAQEGVKRVAIVTPGFSVDNKETLIDVDVEMRQMFYQACGSVGADPFESESDAIDFTYITCLNATDEHIETLAKIIAERL